MRTSLPVLAVAICLLFAGCAPVKEGAPAPHRAAPSATPTREHGKREMGAPSPAAAVGGFALAYTSWSPRLAARSLRRQQRLAGGSLRRSIRRELQRDGTGRAVLRLTVRGEVLALALDRPRRRAFVVVRQWTTTPGPHGSTDETVRVFRVRFQERARRWFVTSWSVAL